MPATAGYVLADAITDNVLSSASTKAAPSGSVPKLMSSYLWIWIRNIGVPSPIQAYFCVPRYVHFGVNLSCLVANLGHTPPFYAHFGVRPPCCLSNLGPQDKAPKQTPAPAPEPVSLIHFSAFDHAILIQKITQHGSSYELQTHELGAHIVNSITIHLLRSDKNGLEDEVVAVLA